jgi:beta-barrel assembly-enhancing protease
MKYLRLLALVMICFLTTGFQLGDFLGDTLTSQEEQEKKDTYQKEYKKARERGMSETEADRYAREAAEKKAQKRRSLMEGVGAIVSSTGEIDYESEMAIGESLALEGFKRYGVPVNDEGFQRYVSLLGNAVGRNSIRPEILYRFVVIESPLYNAFACPGGIIFISSTLVKSMANESQLAGVLAHEVSHVGHKHALKSIRRAKFFEGVGKITAGSMKGDKGKEFQGMIGDLQGVLFDKGLDKEMEFEADLSGMEAAYRTGYDPSAMIEVLRTLREKEGGAAKEGSWFSTHPPLENRIEKCQSVMGKYPDAKSLAKEEKRFSSYRSKLP